MDYEKKYALIFTKIKIDDSTTVLKPVDVVKGTLAGGSLTDDYGRRYLGLDRELGNNARYHAFPVSESFLREQGNDINVDELAFKYLKLVKYFSFVLDKYDKNMCHIIDLQNKNVFKIRTDSNLLRQIINYSRVTLTNNISSNELLNKVKQRVIGQDEAAYKLVNTIVRNKRYGNYEGMKSNILIYGPSGCGKTELIRSIAKELNIPLIIEDITSYTASGYVGDSVKQMLSHLYNRADKDINRAEHGIIVIDEIDKLTTTGNETVNKKDVQEELLKIIEGGTFELPMQRNDDTIIDMDTSNITFILCGAFDRLISSKQNIHIGFNSVISDEEKIISDEDFVSYGLMRELIGRVSVKIPIKPLTRKDYEQILVKSSISSLRIYEKALLNTDNTRVVYRNKHKVISKIAEKASEQGTGARGLKTVVDDMFLNITNRVETLDDDFREVIVTPETVDNNKQFVLQKVRRGNNELSEGIREVNK